MPQEKYPISGSCQCGQVQYQLLAEPSMMVACHCKHCQKLSTSAFSISLFVAQENIRFEGEMQQWSRTADSGNTNTAFFCTNCGNRIYHMNPEQPEIIKLKAGSSLEDTSVIQPQVHLWLSEKQDWYEVPAGVQSFDKQP